MKVIVKTLKRLSQYYSAIFGIAVYFAAVLFWNPKPDISKINPPDPSHRGSFFALAKTSTRIFAVGEYGRISVSMDEAMSWSAIKSPIESALTAIYFLNNNFGWSVGYDGVILKTIDGGLSWETVRAGSISEPPLFSVWFLDRNTGLAVGANGKILRTTDGGLHWDAVKSEIQTHLYAVTETTGHVFWLMGENNTLYQSADAGITWQKIPLTITDSIFGGVAVSENRFVTFGPRGRVSWWDSTTLIDSQKVVDETLSCGLRLDDGRIILAGQRGRVLVGEKEGNNFKSLKISPAKDIGSVLETANTIIFAGDFGLVRIAKSELGL